MMSIKKGFTIAELAIVLAIMSMIAAITIASVVNYMYRVEKLKCETLVLEMNAALAADDRKRSDMTDAITTLNKYGVDYSAVTSSQKFLLGYSSKGDVFILFDENMAPVKENPYAADEKTWIAAKDKAEAEEIGKTYSAYLAAETDGGIILANGYSYGETNGVGEITIKTDKEVSLICRAGEEDKITFLSPSATIYYYGSEENLVQPIVKGVNVKEIIYMDKADEGDDKKDDEDDKKEEEGKGEEGKEEGGKEDEKGEDDDKYAEIISRLKEDSKKEGRLFARCDEYGADDASGKYVKYGYYPQGRISEDIAIEYLNYLVGKPATSSAEEENKNWSKYDSSYYYPSDGYTGFDCVAWYADVDIDGDGRYDYRGVYFIRYRSYAANKADEADESSGGLAGHNQYSNGYEIQETYWFKYEPIVWEITENIWSDYRLLGKDIIDCGQYAENSVGGYSESFIYSFLNGEFFGGAFSSEEQAMALAKLTQDYYQSFVSVYTVTGKEVTDYFSDNAKKTVSDYAKCMGATAAEGFGSWWTRTMLDSGSYSEYDGLDINSDGTIFDQVCAVNSGGGTDFTNVDSTIMGYVPAMRVNYEG